MRVDFTVVRFVELGDFSDEWKNTTYSNKKRFFRRQDFSGKKRHLEILNMINAV